jgi:hypothetical protein
VSIRTPLPVHAVDQVDVKLRVLSLSPRRSSCTGPHDGNRSTTRLERVCAIERDTIRRDDVVLSNVVQAPCRSPAGG